VRAAARGPGTAPPLTLHSRQRWRCGCTAAHCAESRAADRADVSSAAARRAPQRDESQAPASKIGDRQLAIASRQQREPGAARDGRLLLVRLSSERASQAVRQGCSFSKKQELPPALLVGVQRRSAGVCSRRARSHVNAALCGVPVGTRSPGISSGGSCGTPARRRRPNDLELQVECPQGGPLSGPLCAGLERRCRPPWLAPPSRWRHVTERGEALPPGLWDKSRRGSIHDSGCWARLTSGHLGDPSRRLSDHVPLIVTVDPESRLARR
jgi:hypothetical protein